MVRQIPLKVYTDTYTYSLFLVLSTVNHHYSWSSSFICGNNEISGGLSMEHMSFLLFKIGKHYQSFFLFSEDKILHGRHSNLVKSIMHINISIFFYILNDESTKSTGSG
jgi:hypothetical protein